MFVCYHLALYMTGFPGSCCTRLAYFNRSASAERPGPCMHQSRCGACLPLAVPDALALRHKPFLQCTDCVNAVQKHAVVYHSTTMLGLQRAARSILLRM